MVINLKPQSALWLAIVCLACCTAGLAADEAESSKVSLGRVAEFSLQDLQGKTHTPKSWKSAPAVVLLFLGIECPLANGYAPEMTRLAKAFQDRGVVFVGVHCDPDVTAAVAVQHAKEYQLTFPMLLDPQQQLAKSAGVRMMSVAVVLRPDVEVAYRGRIDDRYNEQGKRRLEPTTHDLKQALEAVLAGRQPDPAETKSYGCPLPRIKTTPTEKKVCRQVGKVRLKPAQRNSLTPTPPAKSRWHCGSRLKPTEC